MNLNDVNFIEFVVNSVHLETILIDLRRLSAQHGNGRINIAD
jgi:hypothetical protein